MALKAGDVLLNGQYRILRQIGRGGFGHVYSAWENLTAETVAIKELIPGLVGDPDMVQRFIQEARATQRLTHPNIVRTHNIFQDRGNYYLVMEYLPGGSLEDRLERGPLPVSEALHVAQELCAALSYAHDQGVVHCDLKPANILFTADDARSGIGSAKVADFGIAHVSEQMMTRQFYTATGVAFGTIGYMAPEQLEGVRDDPRLDVYALGTLLYEMLAGRPYLDFEDETTPAAQMRNMQRIQRDAPRPLRSVNRAVPAWLAEVVERCLRKEPSERYDSVNQLAATLARQGVGPSPPAPMRSRFWPALGGAVALLVVIAIVIVVIAGGGDEPAPVPQPTWTAVAEASAAPTSGPTESPTPTLTPQTVPTALPTATPVPPTATSVSPTSTPEPAPTQIIGPYIGQTVTVRVPVADIWPNPRAGGGQKRETQVLMGEQVEITEIREGWYRVVVLAQPSSKDPRGYPGWIEASKVTLRQYELDRFIIVMAPSAYLLASPELDSSMVAEISLDTRLRILQEEAGWLQVELPDGDRAWIEGSRIRIAEAGQSSYAPLPEELVRTARTLLGIRYLWGGSSWKALDCSGVTYRTFHAHGILLARDSRDQAQGGEIVAREDLQPGDLVFYAVGGPSGTVSHVGLYIGDGMAIATYDGQDVMIRAYDDPTYAKEFWGARRYWRE